MAEATRDLKIHLTLTEEEACDLYVPLRPEYVPNECNQIKIEIVKALGYEPQPAPDL